MGVPILTNHGRDVLGGDLGSLSPIAGRLFFEFDAPITREMFFEIFPTAGARFTGVEIVGGVMMVKSGEIFEFSHAYHPGAVCAACECKPAPTNNPCFVCGRKAEGE